MRQLITLILFSFEIACPYNGRRAKLLTPAWLRARKVGPGVLLAVLVAQGAHAVDSTTPDRRAAEAASTPRHQVYVIGNGWHAGLVFPAAALNERVPGLRERFPTATSYEVGWGDIGFYQAKDITVGLALQALFASRGAVLHIVGIQQPVDRFIQGSDSATSCFTDAQYQGMVELIAQTFMQGADGKAIALDKGIYGDSQFYQAKGTYSMLNTCNRWSATVLQAGGLPIHARISLTASSVLSAVRQGGKACATTASAPRAYPQDDAGVPSRPRP